MHDYPTHPLTGTKLNGFQLPNWDKALDVLHRASREMYALPGCRYLGWDIAFLKNGEVAIVECNCGRGRRPQQPHPQGIYHELVALGKKALTIPQDAILAPDGFPNASKGPKTRTAPPFLAGKASSVCHWG